MKSKINNVSKIFFLTILQCVFYSTLLPAFSQQHNSSSRYAISDDDGRHSIIISDYEKANVLINIAARMQQTENAKAAYAKAAKTISSDHEYGRTVRAV